MKTPASDATSEQLVRQTEALSHRGSATMKCGIEAGDLRQIRPEPGDALHRGEIVRLMQRDQGNQLLQLRNHLRIDQGRLDELQATMNHAMSDCQRSERAAVMVTNPIRKVRESLGMSELSAGFPQGKIREDLSFTVLRLESRRTAHAFDLTARLKLQLILDHAVKRELKAR